MARTKSIYWTVGLFLLASLVAAGTAGAREKVLLMATTTSTEDTGLLNVIAPEFKKATGIDLRWTATGTGKALKLGEDCNVDVLMVHAPSAEKKLVEAGFGLNRREIMYNDFIIIGPAADPARIAGLRDTNDALRRIAEARAPFVSRGDRSGTHAAELRLWQVAGVDPVAGRGAWYREVGQGMGPALNTAAAQNAYVLADRGTWLSFRNRQDLRILVEGDARLFNQYGVMLVNPQRLAQVKAADGQRFIDWILSPAGQGAIASYKINGEQLFFPNAAQPEPTS